MDEDELDDAVLRASGVEMHVCADGHLHMVFTDVNDEPFACGALDGDAGVVVLTAILNDLKLRGHAGGSRMVN